MLRMISNLNQDQVEWQCFFITTFILQSGTTNTMGVLQQTSMMKGLVSCTDKRKRGSSPYMCGTKQTFLKNTETGSTQTFCNMIGLDIDNTRWIWIDKVMIGTEVM